MIQKAAVVIDLDGSIWVLWRDHTHLRPWEFTTLKLTDAQGNMLSGSQPSHFDG